MEHHKKLCMNEDNYLPVSNILDYLLIEKAYFFFFFSLYVLNCFLIILSPEKLNICKYSNLYMQVYRGYFVSLIFDFFFQKNSHNRVYFAFLAHFEKKANCKRHCPKISGHSLDNLLDSIFLRQLLPDFVALEIGLNLDRGIRL